MIRSPWAGVLSHGTAFCLSDCWTGSFSTSPPFPIPKEFKALQRPFCCASHKYPGHKIDIQDCFLQETQQTNSFPSTFLVKPWDLYSTFLISSAFEKVTWKISPCWFAAGSSEDYSRWRSTNFIQGEKSAWLQFIGTQAHNRKIAHCIPTSLFPWMLCVVLSRGH